MSEVFHEEWHSFRHRILGMVVAVGLLLLSLGTLIASLMEGGTANLFLLQGRLLIGGLFALLIALLILFGVLTSRRIYWLRFRYGKTPRMIPLPGAAIADIERMVGLLK